MANMLYTFSNSFDISGLLTSTPKKHGLDHQVSTDGDPADIPTADGGRRYPRMNRTPAINPTGSPEKFPRQPLELADRQDVPEEIPDIQEVNLDNLGAVGGRGPDAVPEGAINGAEGGRGPDAVPEGAINNVVPAVRLGGCSVRDEDILQVIGEDRGVPGLLVSNSRVTPANQHFFEFLIGFARDQGDRNASLVRNGVPNGALFCYVILP